MALGKHSRVDGRKTSNYCSTVTVVVFVGVCLIGVWMLMSSSVVPVLNSEVSSEETKTEVKQKVTENNSGRFEDGSGDLPEDAIKDGNAENNQDQKDSDSGDGQNLPEKESENTVEEIQEENLLKEKAEEKAEPEKNSEREAENDDDGKRKDEESNLGDGEVNSGGSESDSSGEEPSSGYKDTNADGRESDAGRDTRTEGGESNVNEQSESEDKRSENELKFDESENKSNMEDQRKTDVVEDQTGEKVEENQDKSPEESPGENKMEGQGNDHAANEVLSEQSEILNETTTQNGAWSTQATESQNEKESQKSSLPEDQNGYKWKLCNVTAGADYIPCLDNVQAIRKLHSTMHYEHRERHCPDEAPTCLVPLPEGYKRPVRWPTSREKIWYNNVPHTKLADIKGHQNWVKAAGDYLNFPGGGTQFKHGALHYIDFIQQSLPNIAWGKQTRVILDVGCGVASFGGYIFERDVLAMSFAPKDEHEAQVQFALERGIPAISAVMGTKRLPFPSKVFDAVHCARCRVPWHIEGGKLLLELNRVLRPGGYFVWSATPVYRKGPEDAGIWKAMSELTKAMCWDLVVIKKDALNEVGVAIFRKPTSIECYEKRSQSEPQICKESDNPDAAWNIQLEACMHKVPLDASGRGLQWPEEWPLRLEKPPYWLKSSQVGVYGKAAPEDFTADGEHWKRVVSMSYLNGLGIKWASVRNVMDMRAVYGGFAAALKDLKVWVMNVVPVDSPDTLPIIYERGLFGIYHDWCESFNTYPRTYDLIHADHLFSNLKKRCKVVQVIAEVDRILRPEGKLIVRDNVETIAEVESMARSLQWKIQFTYSKDNEGLLCVEKTFWRPSEAETIMSAIA